jgi:heme A synthase
MIIRFVAACSIVAVALAVLVAVRHRRQMEARRDEDA